MSPMALQRASIVLAPIRLRWVCLPRTKSGSIDDEVRLGSAEQRVGRAVGPADGVPAENYIRQY
jgi:hypothetical protein